MSQPEILNMMPYPIDKPLHLTFDLEKIINGEYNKNSL